MATELGWKRPEKYTQVEGSWDGSRMKYVYVCEEKAFAPGIVKKWPLVIAHPETPNGRLVRVRVNDLEEKKLFDKLEIQRAIRKRKKLMEKQRYL